MTAHLLAQERNVTRHFWYRLRARAVSRFVPANATVVDVGAGAGQLGTIFELTRPDVRYLYSEPDPALRAHLQDRFDRAAEHVAGTKVDAPACATLLDVIEHVDDDVALLRVTVADLPAGATVVVTVPALRMLWSSWDVNLGHRRRYRRKELVASLEAAGLRIVHAQYLFPELVPVALVRRFAPARSGSEDFPPLPGALNTALRIIGTLTQSLGRWMPLGSSVIAVGVVTHEPSS